MKVGEVTGGPRRAVLAAASAATAGSQASGYEVKRYRRPRATPRGRRRGRSRSDLGEAALLPCRMARRGGLGKLRSRCPPRGSAPMRKEALQFGAGMRMALLTRTHASSPASHSRYTVAVQTPRWAATCRTVRSWTRPRGDDGGRLPAGCSGFVVGFASAGVFSATHESLTHTERGALHSEVESCSTSGLAQPESLDP